MAENIPKILQKDEPLLRRPSAPVPASDFNQPKLFEILRQMSAALASCADGVALAAPQIGISRRIFIISGKILHPEKPRAADGEFINPEIKKVSRRKVWLEEGCLSVRPLYGLVARAEKVKITAYDRHGRKFERSTSGLLAQICQHEIDHLEGILFVDKAQNLHPGPSHDRP